MGSRLWPKERQAARWGHRALPYPNVPSGCTWQRFRVGTDGSPFVLDVCGVMAAIRKVRGHLIDASEATYGTNDSRVNVEVPLVVDESERTVEKEISCAALYGNSGKTANERLPVANQVEFHRDDIAQFESAQRGLAGAAGGVGTGDG